RPGGPGRHGGQTPGIQGKNRGTRAGDLTRRHREAPPRVHGVDRPIEPPSVWGDRGDGARTDRERRGGQSVGARDRPRRHGETGERDRDDQSSSFPQRGRAPPDLPHRQEQRHLGGIVSRDAEPAAQVFDDADRDDRRAEGYHRRSGGRDRIVVRAERAAGGGAQQGDGGHREDRD